MFIVYILKSLKKQRYYIGHAKNAKVRLKRHNDGLVRSTKYERPWEMIFTEDYSTKSKACKRELEIKSYKGGIKFKKLLGLWKE